MTDRAIDGVLPEYQFVERHRIVVHASREAVWRALHEVGAGELVITRVLFGLRTLPARVAGARPRSNHGPFLQGPFLAALLGSGFKLLAETPAHELVLGTSGRFWELRVRRHSQPDPGAAVAAMEFRLDATQGGIILTTETRVAVEDRAARRRFAVYWAAIRPGSGLIRRDLLRAVRKRAERASTG
ncbi:MAG TPA: hypothetical protein VGU71_04070 [Candidatus Dormibacteraeota bacterium]|nr:hypothetical protein [Candidatus Dormibacteraeota bacterium]